MLSLQEEFLIGDHVITLKTREHASDRIKSCQFIPMAPQLL
jgi:hypothetical protein